MSEHYFSSDPEAVSHPREVQFAVRGRSFSMTTDSGVFSHDGLDYGSRVLLESLPPLSGCVLDLGCGWGAMGLVIAATMPDARVTLSDVNLRACTLSERNAAALGVMVEIVQRDGFAGCDARYDAIVLNPPIRTGKANTYAMYAACHKHLTENGALYIVIRKQQGAESARKYLDTLFNVERIARESGFWVLRCTRGG